MGLERQKPEWSSRVLEKVTEESQGNPNIPPYLFLARYIGFEAHEKLKRIDRILAERLDGFKDEVLYPGSDSPLYLALEEKNNEVKYFLDAFGEAWLSSTAETYFDAKQTGKFDFRLLRTFYSEKTFETCVIKFPDSDPRYRMAIPLDPDKLQEMFEKSPSGAIFFSSFGLQFNPTLKSLLEEIRALHAVCRWPLRKYKLLSASLTPDIVDGVNVTASFNWWKTQFSSGKAP